MYIEQGYKSKYDIIKYIVGCIIIIFGWQILGGIPIVLAILSETLQGNEAPLTISQMATTFGSNLFLVLMLLSFVIGLVSIFLVVKLYHKQTITALTTSRKKIDWKRVFFAFTVWAVVSIAMTLVDVYLSPENYILSFEWNKFLILLLIGVILIPLQTSFEEYFFRGYLMQGIGLMSKKKFVPLLITSTIFGLMHIFNPEVSKLGYGIMVYYIGTGFFLGILALMDEGIELSLGFHASNNLITALLVTADWTAFQTNSIYTDVSEPVLGWDVFIPVLVIYPILLFIFSKKYGWTNWEEKLAGDVLSEEEFLKIE
ncbi:CPBP family intramembrane metalloprotease [Cellulophaga baltica]|uniref:CPBP family intramembrane glutamic endopeptidase n=1 Tax=Cellulophaga TaxID=104264 RepID=UPI001C06B408|nr:MULTISPECIES: type II CAAX endopeptidase family protein [Cellulophaga]MBU2996106.1 CPBP family intramembrane metalloprotease [Cellulophaga baltica]MDO6767501.1 type II CAAX endopeptidase family protein [Cellulophaga sp. 1_MG-2023]